MVIDNVSIFSSADCPLPPPVPPTVPPNWGHESQQNSAQACSPGSRQVFAGFVELGILALTGLDSLAAWLH